MPIIAAKNLWKKFGDFTAVAGIDFAIEEGECFGFLGPNGAGKTTTIRMLYGASPITEGELRIMDKNIASHPRELKGSLGIVPQENNLDPDLPVLENLLVYARYFDIPEDLAKNRALELLEFLHLTDKKDSKIEELSLGMKRRLIIARGLINNPRVFILDEPTTGLDPQARHLIWQRLRQLRNEGVTLVLTTHYMEEAAQLCDRIALMDRGKILVSGPPQKLVEEMVGKEVIELRVNGIRESQVLAQLSNYKFSHERAGDTLYLYCDDGRDILSSLINLKHQHLLHRPATLEDLFLKLTGRGLIE